MTQDHSISRRTALGVMGALGAGAIASSAIAGASRHDHHVFLSAEELGYDAETGRYVLPDLPYEHDALEPAIDAETMRIHHGKHHAGYVRGLNRALDQLHAIRAEKGDPALIKHWSRELSFHGSGHANHSLFWLTMAPAGTGGGGAPDGPLMEAIKASFGGFDRFQFHFAAAAKAVEASGWGWLIVEPASGMLQVMQGEKQQNMLSTGAFPLLGIDVWEHAYYLKYQNRRGAYVDAFWSIVNWPFVSELYERLTHAH